MAVIDDVLSTASSISRSVTDAVQTGDFRYLSRDVQSSLSKLGIDIPAGGNKHRNDPSKVYDTTYREVNQAQRGTRTQYGNNGTQYRADSGTQYRAYSGTQYRAYSGTQYRRTPFLIKTVDRLSAWAKILAGGICTGIFGILSLSFIIAGVYGVGLPLLFTGIGFAVFTLGAGAVFYSGLKGKKLVDTFYEYGRIIGNKEFFSIQEIASSLGKKSADVLKDIKLMIKKGFLPQARLDKKETTVMLTDRVYEQYENAEAEREKREEEEERRRNLTGLDREVCDILTEGNKYIKKIREANDAIPDKEMSDKLYRHENIMNRIFDQVRKRPESAGSLRRLMDYYLPTTEKLLNAYIDLDREPGTGDNIVKTKKEIEETLDIINDAFEKLLDSMFENMAWDISSDISVMRSMMEQDGLVDDKLKLP